MKVIHDAVEAAVSEEPMDGVLLLQRVTARGVRARQRQRFAVVGVVAGVAGLVTALALLPEPTAARVDRPAPEATTRNVSYRGLQITVPSAWRVGASRCGTPVEDTVLTPRFGLRGELCGLERRADITSVAFTGATYRVGQRKTRVSGTAALVQFVEDSARHAAKFTGSITLPAMNVTVSVAGPDAARVRALLGTVKRIAVDESGCQTSFSSTPLPARDSAAGALLPDAPTSVSMCRYDHFRLESSIRLDGAQAGVLQDASNRLLPDMTKPLVQSGCPAQIGGIFVIHARYASGPDVNITSKPFSCDGRSPTNGTRTVVLTRSYLELLDSTLAQSTANPPGLVTGTLLDVGGQAPGVRLGTSGTVVFARGGGSTVVHADPDGHFGIILEQGTYAVSGSPTDSPLMCRREVALAVRAFGAGGVEVICPIR